MEPGRPSTFDQSIADIVCARMSEGESLLSICRDETLPAASTIRTWALDNREGFYAQYARARELQCEKMAEDILEIADDSAQDVELGPDGKPRANNEFQARSRLRVDTRKWLLSKVLPKIYGDRTVLAGDKDAPLGVQLIHSIPQPDRGEK